MGRESDRQIHASLFLLSCAQLLRLIFFDLEPSTASQLQPLIVVMTSNLPHSRLRTEDDLRRLRRLLGWQSSGFDEWMRRGTFPLVNLQPGEFVMFSCCRGWVGATGVLLPFHVAGVLWAPAAAPVTALPHSGGDLHPLL
jgi:hypothetical protein